MWRGAIAMASLLAAGAAGTPPPPTPSPSGGEGDACTRLWSVRVADALIARSPVVHPRWDYTAGVALLAIERVAAKTGDPRYRAYVKDNLDRLVKPDGSIDTYEAEEQNLDQINEGRLLLPLYERTHDERYLKAAALLREQLRHQPRTIEGGFWHKKIYPHQMWLDGLYMAEPFYAQWAASQGEPKAFDDIARQFLLITSHTRDPKTGLFSHGWDESQSEIWADKATGRSPHFWGRGLGWLAMALVDVLDYLPAEHKDRATLVHTLTDLADAVARVQDPDTGLWYQVLDEPRRPGNYQETSASAMFVYALAKGEREGYLSERFRGVAERGYAGLLDHAVKVGEDGRVSLGGICQVAGLGGKQRRDGSFEYYMSEPVVSDDLKGVGPFILASLELDR
jgi:unsaturated rhamnogalacturonyl hydrolase